MTHSDELLRANLRKEARKWMELEMEARMAAAVEEIATQAEVGSNILPEAAVQKHVTDATRYAEQEIRRELELAAEEWVERKLREEAEKEAAEAVDPDNPCAGCRGCCG